MNTIQNRDIFFYLSLLTVFFILFEVSFFVQGNVAYLSEYTFISKHLSLPTSVLPGVGFFFFAQLLVHLMYLVSVWFLTVSLNHLFLFSPKNTLKLAITFWSVGILTVLIANQYYFPNSRFAELTGLILTQKAATYLYAYLIAYWVVIFLFAVVAWIKWLGYRLSIVLMGCLVSVYFYTSAPYPTTESLANVGRPNIIIVGIDSLRPDFTSYFGGEQSTPFVDRFLSKSTVFSNAYTPLARTFPSWVSILTGQYPKEQGARSNLTRRDSLHLDQSLPQLLRDQGYHTIYATDEVRFSNIDQTFGFDEVIGPPMGLNDFLLGGLNDFPLSNLIVNTRLGAWLFPNSYANRPAYATYDPNSFLNKLLPTIFKKQTQPNFLAIHFCLPHHPYLWDRVVGKELDAISRYQLSVGRVDEQLHDFFSLLRQAHWLDHAWVVLLSDHGEALSLTGDRITQANLYLQESPLHVMPDFYPKGKDESRVDQSAGHGTDVLGLTQYHSLLAFRYYGDKKKSSRTVSVPVSLTSIKPTLLELVFKSSVNHSLASAFEQKSLTAFNSPIFIESDYSPQAIRTVYPNLRDVLLQGIEIFDIDPQSTRLFVKKAMLDKIIHSKQYAIIQGNWMLAMYPQANQPAIPILVNISNGIWTNHLDSNFAQNSPVKEMLGALQTFYGNELSTGHS